MAQYYTNTYNIRRYVHCGTEKMLLWCFCLTQEDKAPHHMIHEERKDLHKILYIASYKVHHVLHLYCYRWHHLHHVTHQILLPHLNILLSENATSKSWLSSMPAHKPWKHIWVVNKNIDNKYSCSYLYPCHRVFCTKTSYELCFCLHASLISQWQFG